MKPYLARFRNGVWSIWKISDETAKFVSSGFTLKEAFAWAEMRKGTPTPLAPDYPIGRLRAM